MLVHRRLGKRTKIPKFADNLSYQLSTVSYQPSGKNVAEQLHISLLTKKLTADSSKRTAHFTTMNIGDRVRLLRGTEEGILRRFINERTVEVEIEDGFSLPVLLSEVVVIAKEESVAFRKPGLVKNDSQNPKNQPIADRGLYFVFLPINDQKMSLHLINNTELDCPFAVFQEDSLNANGLAAGMLENRSEIKIQDVSMQNFERWGAYSVQFLFFRNGLSAVREPFLRKIRFKAGNFFKNRRKAPLLNVDGYVFQLDEESVKVQPQQIIEKMFGNDKAETLIKNTIIVLPPAEVDLHIEELDPDFASLNPAEILPLQLKAFENQLDKAIATGLDKITFIHGSGNGILRNEIHKRLSKNQQIAFFKDAQKEKFGYGATLVKLK
jgi:hypothetical protein